MKNILFILLITSLFYSCNSEKDEMELQLPEGTRKIEVVDYMNGGGYTFIKGNENGNEFWLAVREMEMEKGDIFYFNGGLVMTNFESKSLNKTFESILFVDKITENIPSVTDSQSKNQMSTMAASRQGHGRPQVEAIDEIDVKPLTNGLTVEGLNKNKSSLAGKIVKIRGIVTKFNGGIMKRNWIHIQDGTDFEGKVDITVTSQQSAKVGETVVIEGTVAVDKDFGAGYFYDVIVENAEIKMEKK